ncbi:MAG: hypothetical protein AABY08_03650 [Candidatus Thermoplasmatota archaeon]
MRAFGALLLLSLLLNVFATGIGVVSLERRNARACIVPAPVGPPTFAEWEMVFAQIDDFEMDKGT